KTALRFYVIGPWLLIPLGLAGLILGGPPSPLRSPSPRRGFPPSPLRGFGGTGGEAGGYGETSEIRDRAYFAWASFVPAYAAAVALFFVAERYRLPLLVPLCAGAGAFIDLVVRAFEARRWPTLAVAAVTAA